MDKQDSKAKRSYELVNPDLVITITMKKMESQTTSGAGTSGDSINNNSKNGSEKDTSSGDKNNNQQPPVANQYTKVTMEGFMSQLSLHQNRQMLQQLAQQGNTLAVNQINANKRFNSAPDEDRLEDSDERARVRRALEIKEGIEVSSTNAECFSSSSSSSSLMYQPDANRQIQNESCVRCQQNQTQNKQLGSAPISVLPLADGEVPKFHSQDYYCHFLVPDLERITACCYYWGKMDRYEAERLLDAKPEGTFLLRDSAQDDYLFSVSFRKYGRSLHARIEQWNHHFSFDSHDPSVFTAPTVTGLVEHYKDPSSVMFFEPTLTSPLHRNYVFSLQQLCRASIVSHTTYDGINDLCLPATMKKYLKEYHYKLKVRVRPELIPHLTSS